MTKREEDYTVRVQYLAEPHKKKGAHRRGVKRQPPESEITQRTRGKMPGEPEEPGIHTAFIKIFGSMGSAS